MLILSKNKIDTILLYFLNIKTIVQFTCDGCVGAIDLIYKPCMPDSNYCNCSFHNLIEVIRFIYRKIKTKEIIGFEDTF